MNKIAAVLLAAGASQRFGAPNKLLADLEGKAIILHVLDVLERAGLAEVIVVTGWDAESVERVLSGRDARLAHNPDWASGMGSSISTGIAALGSDSSGALIVPGDMPLMTAAEVDRLIAAFETSGSHPVTYPVTAADEQRNPVLWPRRFFADLTAIDPAAGAKQLLQQLPVSDRLGVLATDERVLLDIDTPEALAAVLADRND